MYCALITIMSSHYHPAFRQAVEDAGDYANDFWETVRDLWTKEYLGLSRFMHDCLSELPKVQA